MRFEKQETGDWISMPK